MDELKQVKVDNWGIYFLQRLKHFFNRTDYCDLTLQFQDKAQLKVHRLVLSACTEYFELLERTCEMYEDCLVMPDDLQADVVVPIINFMYTGHLEFTMDILEKLYQTSLVMNMPVLTKLLEAHRAPAIKPAVKPAKRYFKTSKTCQSAITSNVISSHSQGHKRTYNAAFENSILDHEPQKIVIPSLENPIPSSYNKVRMVVNRDPVSKTLSINKYGTSPYFNKRLVRGDPKPTRCELPEELENDDTSFTNSFTNISYDSKPLVVHPETSKAAKKNSVFNKSSSSNSGSSNFVQCKKVTQTCSLFDENPDPDEEEYEVSPASITNIQNVRRKSAAQLFDQIVEPENHSKPRVTIESNDSKQASNLDHAKIISEVLKKYPHLVNSNKNIKLKLLNKSSVSPNTTTLPDKKKKVQHVTAPEEDKIDYIDRDLLDTKEAARLIALGVENASGPWICLMCGTPRKALRFGSYYYYRRHLVEVHNEKPATRICEYCGVKVAKRNILIHHLLTKHGVDPPMQYSFPRCNSCDFIALTEASLAKHKITHDLAKAFKCNVCNKKFPGTNLLLAHIQQTGHKYTADKKADLKCIYCLRVFIREGNLYSHIKANHKNEAVRDGVIDDSDEEKNEITIKKENHAVKHEVPYSSDYEEENEVVESNTQFSPQKLFKKNPPQKILNPGYPSPQKYQTLATSKPMQTYHKQSSIAQDDYATSSVDEDELVNIDGEEYYVHNNQLVKYIGRTKRVEPNDEFIISDLVIQQQEMNNHQQYIETMHLPTNVIKKIPNSQQAMQIVVSNEDEYGALMSSSPTEIYDENTNKTLTVLTAPNNTSVTNANIELQNSNIELQNSSSNNMMIIQDDYSLTTAVTQDNPNIMVVYTQPTEDQNKSYQILSTENIEQFVQNAPVITHDYETIATSASDMPVDENNIQQGNDNVSSVINTVTGEEVTENEENNTSTQVVLHEEESPERMEVIAQDEVELSQTYTQEVQTEEQGPSEENNPEDAENVEQNLDEEDIENVRQTNMVIDVPSESTVDKEIPDSYLQNEVEPRNLEKEVEKGNGQQINVDSNIDAIPEEDIVNDTISTDKVNENEILENDQNNIEDVEVIQTLPDDKIPEVVQEKIQILTSEWSEDELDVVEESNNVAVIDKNDVTTNQELQNNDIDAENVTEPEEELEESIENIQKVMEKHKTSDAADLAHKETTLGVPIEENLESKAVEGQNNEVQPPEKISTLLNDWEEDSQEENEEEISNPEDVSGTTIEIHQQIETDNSVIPKDDKIKRLVSDWDDEEDEQKG